MMVFMREEMTDCSLAPERDTPIRLSQQPPGQSRQN
jgi:hypothetical protein